MVIFTHCANFDIHNIKTLKHVCDPYCFKLGITIFYSQTNFKVQRSLVKVWARLGQNSTWLGLDLTKLGDKDTLRATPTQRNLDTK